MKKHDNSNPLDLFITLNEHPFVDDYFMFFIHPCHTASTITSIVESTIDDYLQNRMKTPNDMSFNELIKYLNAFITCK